MSEALLKLSGIRKSYGTGATEVEVLHNISLEIKRGELVAIIGPSGSGKSTLMNIIGCLDTPTEGSYEVMGHNTFALSPDALATLRRDFFGFIFQRYHLLGHLNARENVQVPAVYAGLSDKIREQRSEELLEKLGLGERLTNKPSQLSGGKQQRVSIARALMNGGEIILADEPTGALDSKSGAEVMEILKALNEQGHTIIIVTHDPKIAAHARRVITIRDGNIESDVVNEAEHGSLKPQREEQKNSSNQVRAYIDRLKEAFTMAMRAMVANKMRSLLTMLGIIIGIMSVVCVVALARGAQNQVLSFISSLGTNTITIMPGQKMGDMRSGKIRSLTVKDMYALRGQPYCDSASPLVQTSGSIQRLNIEASGTIMGVSEEYFQVHGMEIKKGRIFSQDECAESPQIAVIDNNTKNTFFKNEDPIGQKLLIKGKPVVIVGVLTDKEVAFMPSDNNYVYIPYTTLMSRIVKQNYISSITVRVREGFSPAVAEASITALLRLRHGRKDFFIQSSDSIQKSVNQTAGTFSLMISAIAVISLIVGGIGVMNIMLVSVTERTREIGIRMAVGARRSDIMAQFLIESIFVCVIGGFLGVLLSLGLGLVLLVLAPAVTLSFSLTSIIIAVVTSSAVGVVFGYMPARAAARLNPIDALARE